MTVFIGKDLTPAGVLQTQSEINWQRLHSLKNTEHSMKEWYKVQKKFFPIYAVIWQHMKYFFLSVLL